MIALLAAQAFALEVQQEIAVGAAFSVHTGAEDAVGGFGPSVTWRLHLGDWFAPHVSLGPRVFLPLTLEVVVGATASVPVKSWRPAIGIELGTWWGGIVRRVEEPDPEAFVRGPVLDLRGVLRPLAFQSPDGWTVSVWSIAIGRGLDHPASTTVVAIEFASIGWLF